MAMEVPGLLAGAVEGHSECESLWLATTKGTPFEAERSSAEAFHNFKLNGSRGSCLVRESHPRAGSRAWGTPL